MSPIVLLDSQKLSSEFKEALEDHLKNQNWDFISYPTTTTLETIEKRCANCEVILVNKDILKEDHFKLLPKLKYILVIATGYDNVDVLAAKKYGIKVSNIPDYSTLIVAQHTIALLLELTNHVGNSNYLVKKENKWYGIGDKHLELTGLTLGIFGFGRIAQQVIKIAIALGMNIIVSSRKNDYTTNLPIKFVDKKTIFKESDIISLHCPLNNETKYLVNKDTLALMKTNVFLINTARGSLINETDLYNALVNKQIKGAALDVLIQEPADPLNPLLKIDNCIITPHKAWISENSLQRWLNEIGECIKHFFNNRFINLV
ncbi:MAG TPA: NAD(P)-dependent oxidoreductase [Burkholderiales bacterium]|nr:NAD(P)-dependent oxidoreductase [Burkholderiales bacterium]